MEERERLSQTLAGGDSFLSAEANLLGSVTLSHHGDASSRSEDQMFGNESDDEFRNASELCHLRM
jgi:hypothetical protein